MRRVLGVERQIPRCLVVHDPSQSSGIGCGEILETRHSLQKERWKSASAFNLWKVFEIMVAIGTVYIPLPKTSRLGGLELHRPALASGWAWVD